MSPLDPAQVELLAQQRKRMALAMAQGRRWYLRSVLMLVVAVVALYRGGQFNTVLGFGLIAVAVMSSSLARSIRRGARESEKKIALMEKT